MSDKKSYRTLLTRYWDWAETHLWLSLNRLPLIESQLTEFVSDNYLELPKWHLLTHKKTTTSFYNLTVYPLCPYFHPTFRFSLNTTQIHVTKHFQPRKRFSLFCYVCNTCNNWHTERLTRTNFSEGILIIILFHCVIWSTGNTWWFSAKEFELCLLRCILHRFSP